MVFGLSFNFYDGKSQLEQENGKVNLAIVEKHVMICFLLSPSLWRTFTENLNFPVCGFCFIFMF